MNSEAKLIFFGAVSIIALGIFSTVFFGNTAETVSVSGTSEGSFACTMDAKICPDGTFVGRVPPYCQFAACDSSGTHEVKY